MSQQPPMHEGPGAPVPQPPAEPRYAPPVYAPPAYTPQAYPAPEHGVPGYPAQGSHPSPGPMAPQVHAPRSVVATNTLAILALISAFVAPFIAPVVLGHISMSQIRRTGEGGRGLAIAALILGYIQVAFWAILIAFIIWVGVVAAAAPTL